MNAITQKNCLNEGKVPWREMSRITKEVLRKTQWQRVDVWSQQASRWNPATSNGAFYSGRPVASVCYRIRPAKPVKKKVVKEKAKTQPPTRTVTYTKEDGTEISEGQYCGSSTHYLRGEVISLREKADQLAAKLRDYNKFAKKEGWDLA